MNKVNLVSLIKDGIIGLGFIFGIFFVFFVIPLSVIKNEKILNIYISYVKLVILLLVVLIVYKNNKPKYIDGKYVWKDGRIYEGDWNKKYGANGKGKLTWADGSYYEGEFKNGNLSGKGKRVCPSGESYEGYWEKNKGNGKGKLTWADGSYYEGEFKNGNLSGKGKRVCPSGESYEGYWEKNKGNGKGKLTWADGSYYEGEFKNGKPHGMGIIKMKNGYYYEGEFSDGKKTGIFKKQVLTTGGVIEGEFRDNGCDGFDGIGKVSTSNGFVFEGTFKNGKLSGSGKTITPNGEVFIGVFDKGKLKKGKQILKNGEYSEGNWVYGCLTGMARYYFKDGSYYEGECGDMGWQGVGTYVTKKGDKYSTEFPYEIIDVFMYGLKSKIKEIQGNLNYIPKTEKEKTDEKNMYLEILKSGTDIQKEIAKLSLEGDEKSEKLLNSLKMDSSEENLLNFYKGSIKFVEEEEKKYRNIANKCHINFSKKKTSSYSYSQFFFRLDGYCINEIVGGKAFVKIFQFLSSKNILDFVIKREEKNKERVVLIDEFSDKYSEYVQNCLDWREYEKIFWKCNFKPDKSKK